MNKATAATSTETDDNPVRAVLLIAFAVSIFSVQDVIVRLVSGDYPLTQILVLRAVVVISLTVAFLAARGQIGLLRPNRIGLLIVRAVLIFFSFALYYLALVSIPMAAAVSIYFVAPLVLTGMAAIFGKETVGVRRWTAVIIGLVGVIVIMRPGLDTIDPAALLALAGAFVYAAFNMLTRRLARTENAWALSFSSNLIGYFFIAGALSLLFGSGGMADESHPAVAFMTRPWIVPTLFDGVLIAVTGVIATVGFYCLTEGYRTAPSSLAAPFEYLIIPWSALWGFVFWMEIPHWTTLIGISLILGSGLYVIFREQIVGQRVVISRVTRMRP